MAVQFLRTADTRETLSAFHASLHPDEPLCEKERANLHTALLWDLPSVEAIARHIGNAIWVFAKNTTATPFVASDNPVAFRSKDNKMWLKAGFLTEGTYAVYPLAPDMVMFCHERDYWRRGASLNDCLSPISLTKEMVESENSGQVFMASRFVMSPIEDFEFARAFARDYLR